MNKGNFDKLNFYFQSKKENNIQTKSARNLSREEVEDLNNFKDSNYCYFKDEKINKHSSNLDLLDEVEFEI